MINITASKVLTYPNLFVIDITNFATNTKSIFLFVGYIGNINFHIGYTTADQIMPTEHAAEQRAAFQALKFLRYLSPNSKFAAPAPDASKPTPGGYSKT